ncbi:MAG: hypothetical protein WBP45_02930, partial [Daejeonella sp.]
MSDPTQRPTVVEILNKLRDEGFTHDFNLHNNNLLIVGRDISLSPDEFEIVKVYRFEGFSDPGDNSVLYAINAPEHDVKG